MKFFSTVAAATAVRGSAKNFKSEDIGYLRGASHALLDTSSKGGLSHSLSDMPYNRKRPTNPLLTW